MDLKEFYFQNVTETEYHHFRKSIEDVNFVYNVFTGAKEVQDYEFYVYDLEEAITKFRELCQPEVTFDKEKKCWFYLITYYFFKNGYEIKEFPRLLQGHQSSQQTLHMVILEIGLSPRVMMIMIQ